MAIIRNNIIPYVCVLLIFILCSCSGGNEPIPVKQITEKVPSNFDQVLDAIIFNPQNQQDFSKILISENMNLSDTLTAEFRTLIGLAHIYQGELYEVTSQILNEVQLDLYEGSDDLAHGDKFPANYQNLVHQDEMFLWRGIDACDVKRIETAQNIWSRIHNKDYSGILEILAKFYQLNSGQAINSNTLIDLSAGREKLSNQSIVPSLAAEVEFENQYLQGKYVELLFKLQAEIGTETFPDEEEFIYFNSRNFKLAALCHYQLGILNLEKSFNDAPLLPDSTVYQLISIMNLAHIYKRFEKSAEIKKLWLNHKDLMTKNSDVLLLITQNHQKRPYLIDWVYFLSAVEDNVPNFQLPIELANLDYRRDKLFAGIMNFLNGKDSLNIEIETKGIIDQLLINSSLIDKYPTLMSVFVQELNLSTLRKKYKPQIQDLTELLVFNVSHSDNSWQRNRPAFLISLFGTLRWHGSRLPNCNGFVQDLAIRYPPLLSLASISGLFTQQLLNTKSNPKLIAKNNTSQHLMEQK
ncbi:MAG: hypothetical protein ISR95_02930 [Candidatus Marinimicrobia bacterium]|nr:hypothetical protein [Candidatus Neomarinimicrobiota bacterium]